MPHQIHDQGCHRFGEHMAIGRIVGDVDLAHASDLSSLLANRGAIFTSDEQMHLADLGSCRDRGESRVVHRRIIMFYENQGFHI